MRAARPRPPHDVAFGMRASKARPSPRTFVVFNTNTASADRPRPITAMRARDLPRARAAVPGAAPRLHRS
eukprot:3984088-Pyramimonas_sp.AAC.1